jgi:hypothetical protein
MLRSSVDSRFSMKTAPHFATITCIFLLWSFATFWNIDKAFHIDDAGHMEIARWIAAHPLHPMSGGINWRGVIEPISELNQPHLYFYLMAAWSGVFGNSEVSMHCLMSLFSLWAIIAFYRLATFFSHRNNTAMTAFFALSYAFVVGQGTMVDVPLLAIWLEFYYVLLNPRRQDSRKYAAAALLCGAALLVKYTSLVLLPALVMHIVLRKRIRYLAWVSIPLLLLVFWSLFNLYDYGSIHLLGREHIEMVPAGYLLRLFGWLSTLGAIMPFAVHFFFAECSQQRNSFQRWIWLFIGAVTLIPPLLVLLTLFVSIPNLVVNLLLFGSFMTCGVGTVYLVYRYFKTVVMLRPRDIDKLVLIYWIGGCSIFIMAFAPFMAARHVLLVMPAFILLLYPQAASPGKFASILPLSLLLTLGNTTLLAKADFWYAGIYKYAAFSIIQEIPKGARVWFMGHWGWQWYAQQAGMQQLALNSSPPAVGDYLVIPLNVDGGDLLPQLAVQEISTRIVQRERWYQRFASVNLYISPWLPWGYSEEPMEQFKIFRITGKKQ